MDGNAIGLVGIIRQRCEIDDAQRSSGDTLLMTGRQFRTLAWCALAVLAIEWFVLGVLGDRVWWTVPLLFGPRWVLAVSWLGCVPWIWFDIRRAALPALVGLAVAVLALMGCRLGVQRANLNAGVPFRVMELNADGRHSRPGDIDAEIRDRKPDLIVIVECDADLAREVAAVHGYQIRTGDGATLCLLTRGEITEWEVRNPMDLWKQGGSGGIVRAIIQTPAGLIKVGVVHLATPRNALDNYFDRSELLRQGPNTLANIALRELESGLARDWIFSGSNLPTVIAGDFNLPVESAIYRRHWGDLRNAFSRAGTGAGYTKYTHFWGTRIDHVLTSEDIGTHASFIGRDVGSDHRPLIADLVLPTVQRTSTAR